MSMQRLTKMGIRTPISTENELPNFNECPKCKNGGFLQYMTWRQGESNEVNNYECRDCGLVIAVYNRKTREYEITPIARKLLEERKKLTMSNQKVK
jgi:Zn ribbon nucleic-acid-binding protein